MSAFSHDVPKDEVGFSSFLFVERMREYKPQHLALSISDSMFFNSKSLAIAAVTCLFHLDRSLSNIHPHLLKYWMALLM